MYSLTKHVKFPGSEQMLSKYQLLLLTYFYALLPTFGIKIKSSNVKNKIRYFIINLICISLWLNTFSTSLLAISTSYVPYLGLPFIFLIECLSFAYWFLKTFIEQESKALIYIHGKHFPFVYDIFFSLL